MLTHISPDTIFSYFEMEIAELKQEIINSKLRVAEAVMNDTFPDSSIRKGELEVHYIEMVIEYRIKNKLN